MQERPGALAWPEELERFFDRAIRGFGLWPGRRSWRHRPWVWRAAAWLPDMDVFQRDGKIVVHVDLPGLKREDIEVTVQEGTLIIRGGREEEKEIKEEDYYCCERAAGEFSRAISLPEGVSGEGIEAAYQDGVLEVTIPRPAPPEARKVDVAVK